MPTATLTPSPSPSSTLQGRNCYLPLIVKGYTAPCPDEFSGPAPSACWEWVREDPTHWSLTARPGFMRITTQKGGIYYATNNARNLLLQPAPDGDFVIETRVLFTPTENYQMAGLVVYQDDDDFLVLLRAFCDTAPPVCVGNAIYYDLEQGGGDAGHYVTAGPASPSEAYLRLVRQGNVYEGYYSADGASWTLVGTHTPGSAFGPVRVGLTADDSDQGAAEIPADFDYFHFEAP